MCMCMCVCVPVPGCMHVCACLGICARVSMVCLCACTCRFFQAGESEESVLNVPVGSVKANTELTYEFRVKTTSAKPTAGEDKTNASQNLPELMIEGTHHMPFQLQIKYTDSDGAQCMRVLTQARPVTSDRKVAKQGNSIRGISGQNTVDMKWRGMWSISVITVYIQNHLFYLLTYKALDLELIARKVE